MKKRKLGKSGFKVSEMGLGCWQLGGDFGPIDDDQARAILEAAHEAGINFWDTADVYGGGQSEERIGAPTTTSHTMVSPPAVGRRARSQPRSWFVKSSQDASQDPRRPM